VDELRRAAEAERRPEVLALLEGTSPEATLQRFWRWQLGRMRERKGYVPPFAWVGAHVRLGELDEAFTWLERAFERRDKAVLLLAVNPGYDPLRGDGRLDALAARVGLPHLPLRSAAAGPDAPAP
jgi:hypothetical protein